MTPENAVEGRDGERDGRQDRLRAKVESEKVRRRWMSRRRRRPLVVAEAVSAVLFAGGIRLLAGGENRLVGLLVVVVTGGLLAVVGTQIGLASRFRSDYHDLDERQRAEQARARLLGDRVTNVALAVAFVAALLLSGLTDEVDMAAVPPAAFLLLALNVFFPAAWLTWTQPAESDDEPDEEEF
ncbi:hypothetical protein [Streptomyces cacaoi]|uniref:hypothetical protein n=1 Tax=Streptomyces cacaoi TaxID=1898 RepID=UPI002618A60B|nr:hypothetical protein [Streptomyces cacaoi]